ncbi:MAG: serine/threonine-protein kinase [Actinomycetota bacterium]
MADLPSGTQLGGYRVATILGRGGMGVVYLAQQLALGRRVALKVISPDLSDDPEFRERFSREAQLAAAIDHRNIIPVYDAGEADGRLYISMRYVKGLDLRTVLQLEGPMDPERVLGIVGAVADALDAAHGAGLVHRDVKPANVLIEDGPGPEPDRVFLTDFGLTKRVDAPRGMTRTGIFVGTPDYASPEQCAGKPVDGRTDEYSLACVLHECLSGATPFPRDSDAQVLAAHLLESPPRLSAARPGLPPALDDVLARGMAKDPGSRYATCGELAGAALAAVRGESPAGETLIAPPPARAPVPGAFPPPDAPPPPMAPARPPMAPVPPPGASGAAPTQAPPSAGPTTVPGPRRRVPRRGRWVAAVVAAVVLVGGGVAVALALAGGGPSTPRTTSPPATSPGQATSPAPTSPPATTPAGGLTLTDYARQVDGLLSESESFRQQLVTAVGESRNASPARQRVDLDTVRKVVAERETVLHTVTTWQVPVEAEVSNDLLATAFRDSIVDDQDYARLVQAYIAGDDAAATAVLGDLEAHRAAATDPDKEAFVRSYNAIRQRLGLDPLPSDFRF